MSIISYALKGNLKRFSDNLNDISKNTGKSKSKLFFNFLYCFMKIGSGYSDYLNYKLYTKTKKELKEYVTIKTQDKFYEIVSPSKYKTFFTVKPNFLNNFKQYIGRDYFYDGTKQKLKDFLKNNKIFMEKPIDGLGGHGVKKCKSSDIKNISEYYDYLKQNNLFIEEYVKQNKEIDKICSSCVNTIRVMTFGYNGKSEILDAYMRIGNGEADVDNFHQGGMGVKINIETGCLVGEAINKNLDSYEIHPKSKIKFDGFQIPNWEIVKKTVLDAALVNEHIHVVGWDVAITDKGCVLIEGNRRPGFDLPQVVSKRGRKDIMMHVLNIMNEKENKNYKI